MENIDRSLSTKVLQSLNANQIANLKAVNAKLKQKTLNLNKDSNKENICQLSYKEPKEVNLPRRQGHETYLPTILSHLHATSTKNIGCIDPFDEQCEINRRMRCILFNWLLEIQFKFELKTRTIFMTTNIFDRFLHYQQVSKDQLQLVGIACLWIASKYEDIYPPQLRELVHLCDDLYTAQDIIDCETNILSYLNFDFVFVSGLDAHEINTKLRTYDDKRVNEASMLILHVFLYHSCVDQFGPFILADFARYKAMKLLGIALVDKGLLDDEMIEIMKDEFKTLVESLQKDKLVALEIKYKSLFIKLLYSVFN